MADSLIRLVHELGRPSILVVGDLMLDRYVEGSVGRISPEAPIPVLKAGKESLRLGGAGSVTQNLAALGADVSCCGVVGFDPHGDAFIKELRNQGISGTGVFRVDNRPTTLKTRFVARHQQVLRVDREDSSPLPEHVVERIAAYAEEAVAGRDAVIIQDYSKGLACETICRRVIDACRAEGIPVLVDPGRGADYTKYRGAGCIKPNRAETAEAARIDLSEGTDAASEAARKLIEMLDLDAAVITLDSDGLLLLEAGGDELRVPAHALEVFDVTGAGDMIISVLAMVMAAGGCYRDAVQVANAAAAVEVTKLGVQPVTRHEIVTQFNRHDYSYARKIVDEQTMTRIVNELRGQGKQIVFTNGCFDLLHVGHIRLLHDARKLGDVLIVGLNTDASISGQKGPDRPILPKQERAHVLAAIADVDYIVMFDDETPLHLVADVVMPDILVKGSDYTDKLVVGRAETEARGGRVELVRIVPGMSTSNIVSKILDTAEKPPKE